MITNAQSNISLSLTHITPNTKKKKVKKVKSESEGDVLFLLPFISYVIACGFSLD